MVMLTPEATPTTALDTSQILNAPTKSDACGPVVRSSDSELISTYRVHCSVNRSIQSFKLLYTLELQHGFNQLRVFVLKLSTLSNMSVLECEERTLRECRMHGRHDVAAECRELPLFGLVYRSMTLSHQFVTTTAPEDLM